jgi:hypothetical protein
MIAKFLYTTCLLGFVYSFAATTNLPRLILSNFIAAPAAATQPGGAEANQPQQPIKKAATGAANGQKVSIMPAAQVSTPKPQPAPSQTPAQLGFLFALSLLNFFICYKLFRWIYRVFLRTPIYLIVTAFKFLIVKPYRYLTTPQTIATYEVKYSVPENREPRTIIV